MSGHEGLTSPLRILCVQRVRASSPLSNADLGPSCFLRGVQPLHTFYCGVCTGIVGRALNTGLEVFSQHKPRPCDMYSADLIRLISVRGLRRAILSLWRIAFLLELSVTAD